MATQSDTLTIGNCFLSSRCPFLFFFLDNENSSWPPFFFFGRGLLETTRFYLPLLPLCPMSTNPILPNLEWNISRKLNIPITISSPIHELPYVSSIVAFGSWTRGAKIVVASLHGFGNCQSSGVVRMMALLYLRIPNIPRHQSRTFRQLSF